MAKSTAPILLIGGVTIVNRWLELLELNRVNTGFASEFFVTSEFWKPAVATGLTVGAFALLEKVNQPLTVGVAWVALVTTLLVPIPLGGTQTGNRMTVFERINHLQSHPEKYM
jgi:hypothetical protein